MGGAPMLMLVAAAGVTFGWTPDQSGAGVDYIIQIPPTEVAAVQRIGQIESTIPNEIRGHVSHVVVRIGEGKLPRQTPAGLAGTTPQSSNHTAGVIPIASDLATGDGAVVPIPSLGEAGSPIVRRSQVMKPAPQGSTMSFPTTAGTTNNSNTAPSLRSQFGDRTRQGINTAANSAADAINKGINGLAQNAKNVFQGNRRPNLNSAGFPSTEPVNSIERDKQWRPLSSGTGNVSSLPSTDPTDASQRRTTFTLNDSNSNDRTQIPSTRFASSPSDRNVATGTAATNKNTGSAISGIGAEFNPGPTRPGTNGMRGASGMQGSQPANTGLAANPNQTNAFGEQTGNQNAYTNAGLSPAYRPDNRYSAEENEFVSRYVTGYGLDGRPLDNNGTPFDPDRLVLQLREKQKEEALLAAQRVRNSSLPGGLGQGAANSFSGNTATPTSTPFSPTGLPSATNPYATNGYGNPAYGNPNYTAAAQQPNVNAAGQMPVVQTQQPPYSYASAQGTSPEIAKLKEENELLKKERERREFDEKLERRLAENEERLRLAMAQDKTQKKPAEEFSEVPDGARQTGTPTNTAGIGGVGPKEPDPTLPRILLLMSVAGNVFLISYLRRVRLEYRDMIAAKRAADSHNAAA